MIAANLGAQISPWLLTVVIMTVIIARKTIYSKSFVLYAVFHLEVIIKSDLNSKNTMEKIWENKGIWRKKMNEWIFKWP